MLMKNPEFRRNLWLELSPQRLILMPLVLAVIGALTVVVAWLPTTERIKE